MRPLHVPAVPDSQRARGEVSLRYEDICQDGSLKVGSLPHAMGVICFRDLWLPTQIHRETRPLGIVPILSRLMMEGTGGPISVRYPVQVEGAYQLGHTRDLQGQVNRLLLRTYGEVQGPRGRTNDPALTRSSELVHVGRVVAEHVFTRPFGAPAERKVLELPLSTGAYVPPDELSFREAAHTLALPEGARWSEDDFTLDPAPLCFGLTHTDSNQHVNSLVYPHVFEEAALRRAFALGQNISGLLMDQVDVAFRKPVFSGERMRVWLRGFSLHGKTGFVGFLGAEGTTSERAHCVCALTFRAAQSSQ